jgi:hypothetical protein
LRAGRRRVRIFLAEKGIAMPREQIDSGAVQQKIQQRRGPINQCRRVAALQRNCNRMRLPLLCRLE